MQPSETSRGLANWVAGLPSEISWNIPIAVVAILLVGWVLPGKMLRLGGLGWGPWSLLYAAAGLLAIGVMLFLRRKKLGAAELALHWFAAVMFYAVAALSILTWLDLYGTVSQPFLTAGLPVLTAAALVAARRREMTGLEFAVYWFGVALILFWGILPLAAEPAAASALGPYFKDIYGYRTAGIVLAGVVVLSALAILLCRLAFRWRSPLSGPELAVYLIGIAYMLYVAVPLAQTPSTT